MRVPILASFLVISLAAAQPAAAQQPFNAQWMWLTAADRPAERVWFRREVRSDAPSTGAVRIIGDDRFTLWVNGEKVGEGQGETLFRFNLNGIVERGPNVIAVAAENRAGQAGLFVDGEVRTQRGEYIRFDGGPEWRATTTEPADDWLQPGFDTSGWQTATVLGPHEQSPWKHIVLKETYLDRYELAPGFELKRIAEPELVGSLVTMTWGNSGRLLASREKGPILTVTDTDGDGTYDKVIEYSSAVTNCQGLCMVFDDLYAVGNGPQGAGIYRLPDANDDGVADSVHLVTATRGGMGEHGPHAVVFGPDGWLYYNSGNHAWIPHEPRPTTAVRDYYEGDLLQPKFEDARGHARGIKAPGGTIWRFTPDGKEWYCETNGFRNEYDIAFNRKGDLFSFDSDMEWDVGMPWYRPVRVNHCIPGAEFGWRSGAAKWPAYYFDSLPGTVDIGRGSPTGVVFYNHRQFPEKYRGTFLVCDWSMGRIIAVHLKPDGATYAGTWENLVTGNPLNVSDIIVDRDGSVVFCTGGRGTEGGIYRITFPKGDQTPADADTVAELIDLPQIQSTWAREIAAKVKQNAGDAWQKQLLKAASTGSEQQQLQALTLLAQLGPRPDADTLVYLTLDSVAAVRAFATWLLGDTPPEQADIEQPSGYSVKEALSLRLVDEPEHNPLVQRRACEAFVRSGITPPVEPLLKLLGSEDRWLRFAARLALERVPVEKWMQRVLSSDDPWVLANGLLALHRTAPELLPTEVAVMMETVLLTGELTDEQRLAALRMLELTLLSADDVQKAAPLGKLLLEEFPTGKPAIDAETARILAALDVPGAAPKLVRAMETADSPAQQMHYALVLSYLDEGWTADLKRRVLAWYEETQSWEGGHSMQPYLANIVGAGLKRWTPDERRDALREWERHPFAAALLLRQSQPEQIADFDAVIGAILDDRVTGGSRGREELVTLAIQGLGQSQSPEAGAMLRELYDAYPDRRDLLARAMAASPTAEDWPQLVRTLQFADPTTLQLVLNALTKIDRQPEKAEEIRSVILAGLELGAQGGNVAVKLLRQWTGSKPAGKADVSAALAHYQKWYSQTYPDAPPAELPQVDPNKSKYTFAELQRLLENDTTAQADDIQRGRKIFADAKCVKCHRFDKEGETIGPDLTSVRRRFQRKEIIESMVYPSQVISDQYRMVTVVTKDGLVHNGMPVPTATDRDKLTLLLSDATRLEIPRSEIDEQVVSKVSVMPAGLLNDLTPEQIADLFAFLETSKFNEVAAAKPE